MCPVRRGDDGYEVGPTWESIVERKIQDAVEAGEFDRLEGMGRPLELEERNPHAGDWELGFHVLRNADIPPRWIELSREVETRWTARVALLDRAAELAASQRPDLRGRLRVEYAQLIVELNEAIDRFNLVAPFWWLQKVRPSLETELRVFDQRWPGETRTGAG